MPRVGPTQTPTVEYNKKAEQEFRRDVELNLRGVADGVDSSQHMSDIASAIASKRTVLGIIPIGITTYGPKYTVTTPSEDRTLDVGSPTIGNTTNVLGTLIEDLQKSGVIS